MDEFSIINTWFRCQSLQPSMGHVLLGNGDDAAVISIPSGKVLVQSMDTQVAGVHFPAEAPAKLVAYRALAAAVSDLAAMGAIPHSFFLALTLPELNIEWISNFSNGMATFIQQYNMALIGGDTTKGPLSISFHVQGLVSATSWLTRSQAVNGDRIFISGHLGDGGAALPLVKKGYDPEIVEDSDKAYLLKKYYFPQPQLALGQWLVKHGCKVAIDVSDGLLADLQHVLTASKVGACIDINKLPISSSAQSLHGKGKAQQFALTAGDDYQLCFCWPKNKVFPDHCPIKVTEIGEITGNEGIIDAQGNTLLPQGFRHF